MGKKDLKDSYRPVSILPVLSKLYERSLFKQISEIFEKYFLKKTNVDLGKATAHKDAP